MSEKPPPELKMEPGKTYRIGNHLWGRCGDCGRIVKLTGWTRGVHLCVDEEEISRGR